MKKSYILAGPVSFVLLMLVFSASVQAATYTVTAGRQTGFGDYNGSATDSSPVFATTEFGNPASTYASMTGTEGLLQGIATRQLVTWPGTPYGSFSGSADIDFVIIHLPGFESASTTVNVRASAFFSAAFSPDKGSAEAYLSLPGSRQANTFTNGVNFSGAMTSGISTLTVGVVYTLRMGLLGQAGAGNGESGVMNASLVLGGLPDGRVFDFLGVEGYTVNSVDGHILDNVYVGTTAISAVPEPASWLLMAVSLLLIRFVRRFS